MWRIRADEQIPAIFTEKKNHPFLEHITLSRNEEEEEEEEKTHDIPQGST